MHVEVRLAFGAPIARAARADELLAEGAAVVPPGQSRPVPLTFTAAGRKALAGGKALPIRVTVTVAAGGRTAASTVTSRLLAAVATEPAKLQVERAGVTRGKLDVLARITRRASGDVRVSYQAGGVVRLSVDYLDDGELRTWTGRARISRGRWSAASAIPAALDDGYLSIQYTGDRRARGGPIRGEQDGKALWALR